jgi:hypothetical protein
VRAVRHVEEMRNEYHLFSQNMCDEEDTQEVEPPSSTVQCYLKNVTRYDVNEHYI